MYSFIVLMDLVLFEQGNIACLATQIFKLLVRFS